jgi:hypothetical protein
MAMGLASTVLVVSSLALYVAIRSIGRPPVTIHHVAVPPRDQDQQGTTMHEAVTISRETTNDTDKFVVVADYCEVLGWHDTDESARESLGQYVSHRMDRPSF